MEIATSALVTAAVAFAGWRKFNPKCPNCSSRRWDRKLCRPLLLCRHCAQRVDPYGRRYN